MFIILPVRGCVSETCIDEMLSLPRSESRLKPEARERVREYLNAEFFEASALESGFAKEDIFINYVGLAHNAGISLHPYINDKVLPHDDSVEAKYFIEHFETVEYGDTRNPVFSLIKFKFR